MTKRLIIAAVFLSVSLFISIFANIYILKSINELYTLCENAAERENSAEFSELLEYWQAHKTAFSVFLKHADADTLTRYFLKIENFADEGNYSQAKSVIFELKAFLLCTKEGELLKFENIF